MNRIANYLPTESFQHWSAGCGACRYGIALTPELTGACELHLERLAQAISHEITFCECPAGVRYRVFLLNLRQRLIEEARKDKRLTAFALRNSHPEIEWAQERRVSRTEYVPNIHAA